MTALWLRVPLLWRTFLAQFFASESVSSDIQLRRSMIGVLSALLPAGLFLMANIFPAYERIARYKPELVEPLLAHLGLIFVVYSMAITGLIAVMAWESLTFERRDAMVLGPLPIPARTLIGAKLGALALFLVGMAATINAVTGVPFAMVTGNVFGFGTVVRYFFAHLVATVSAATFIFCSIVALRAFATNIGSDRSAARIGALLQFSFVSAILSFLVLLPELIESRGVPFADGRGGWLPPAWFLGVFEWLRGSPRDVFGGLALRGAVATILAVLAAVGGSMLGFRRQLRLALAPPPLTGRHGGARVARYVARMVTLGNRPARALAEFILLTLTRNRAQQSPIAINVALGLALVVGSLAGDLANPAALLQRRTAILWIPFMAVYWLAIGLRASFFEPSDIKAGWMLRLNTTQDDAARRRAIVAAALGILWPPAMLLSAATAPIVGVQTAMWSLLLTGATALLLAEWAAVTYRSTPYIRPYVPGHAKLRLTWPLYVAGVYVFVFSPARALLTHQPGSAPQIAWLAALLIGTFALELFARQRPRSLNAETGDEDEEMSVITLALGPAG